MRCRACDKVLTVGESQWYEDRGEHEDMCSYCRAIAMPHQDTSNIHVEGEEEGEPWEQLELDLVVEEVV